MNKQTKIIVLDDDPTGSQTVHSCPLLMRWNRSTIETGLKHASPLLFILTNSRSMSSDGAARVTEEVCLALREARVEEQFLPLYVSRSDSTLRGHFPVETDAMAQGLGPFDAIFLTPAFFEGGRVTRQGVHYISRPEGLTRVDATEYARDSVFGYGSSSLPQYVEEKTLGRVPASEVGVIPRGLSERELTARLFSLRGQAYVVVDAEEQGDYDRFARSAIRAVEGGKRFLFRSGASLLTSLASLPPQPVAQERMGTYVRADAGPGVVVCGSHVKLSTKQLELLLEEPDVAAVEVDVGTVTDGRGAYAATVQEKVEAALARGLSPVVFTSREEQKFGSTEERLVFGRKISRFLEEIVARLPESTGFLISKGGITSHDILSEGLGLRYAEVLGQIFPGVTVVRTPEDHRSPGLPVVIFPGNVGDRESLRTVYRRISHP